MTSQCNFSHRIVFLAQPSKSIFLAIFASIAALTFLPLRSNAADLIAIIDLKFLEETDKTAAVLCLGDEDDDCVVWATHYLWEARVRKTISGAESEKRFLVLYGRHALMKKDIRGVVVVMNRLESSAKTEPRYQIREMTKERKLVCFSSVSAESAPLSLAANGQDALGCFDLEADDE